VTSPAAAIVLAGGKGARFGDSRPKQLAKLAGQPVLYHTLRKFDRPALFGQIVVAANPEWMEEINEIAEDALRRVPFTVVNGGTSRNRSVRAALNSLTMVDRVLIHDGVRPLVREELIMAALDALEHARCVVPIVPSVDPIVVVEDGVVRQFMNRAVTHRGQSPQGFWVDDLRAALVHEETLGLEHETLFEAILAWNAEAHIMAIPGDLNNLKITLPVDHMIAGRLLLED
jgi:2-C-methyl-D-erythritol 4-phosphate cytidylyltransferase